MAEHPLPSSNMAIIPRSVYNKLTETVENFKLRAVPLFSLYEEWKSVQSSFAMAVASMEARAKKLDTDESEIRVREENLIEKTKKVEMREGSVNECWEVIEERKMELEKREREYDERVKTLEFNEKVVDDALDVKEKGIRELGESLEVKKAKLSEELRDFEARKREIEEECRCLEAKEKGFMDRCVVLEVREMEMREEIKLLELKKKGMVEEFTALEEREKEIKERGRVQGLRGKEMKELGEDLEMKAKEIVEGRRVLDEKRKGVDGMSRVLEGREKELDERSKEAELREKQIKERENDLNVKEKELLELERKLEVKKKDVDKGFQACSEELRLKKDELVQSHRLLGLKESEIVEKCKELELKQEMMNEQWRVLDVKEKEVSCRLKALELKENEMNDKDAAVKEEPLKMLEFEEEQDLKAMLIKKCSNLFKQADEVLKRQYSEGKIVEDGCIVAGVKEVISENPETKNLAVASVVAPSLFAEIQLVFRNDDAIATASYLTKHAETVSMWKKNILPLSEEMKKEITGLLESLTAEHKHLQAAMCTCVFKRKDVYPPEFLLNTYLEHVREKAEEIVKKASEKTAQDDAANMELTALRNVLRCISYFKLEPIYPSAPHELRITQLEKEMEVRKKTTCDLGTKLEASESTTQTKTSPTANVSTAISDSHPEKKRKASLSSSVKQNKHHRGSDSRNRPIPYYLHQPHVTPYRNRVLQPTHYLTTNGPDYRYPPTGVIYDRLLPRHYPGDFQRRPHYTVSPPFPGFY